jgi:hypothetical protein
MKKKYFYSILILLLVSILFFTNSNHVVHKNWVKNQFHTEVSKPSFLWKNISSEFLAYDSNSVDSIIELNLVSENYQIYSLVKLKESDKERTIGIAIFNNIVVAKNFEIIIVLLSTLTLIYAVISAFLSLKLKRN